MMDDDDMVHKIRKRGCSSSSSASSRVHHYRFKRPILVGKARTSHGIGLGGSRSNTPVPTWKMTPSRTAVESPSSRPISARRLAATLWEMNTIEKLEEGKKLKKKTSLKRENMKLPRSSLGSGPWPSYLSNRSHSPVSQIETKKHLKDVSNALTTSNELLKIMNRILSNTNQPSSCMSLVSALHAETERARILVSGLIQEHRSDQSQTQINYVIAGELELERKLRKRSENLNKKLGLELVETKESFIKVVKELEEVKKAREITERLCDELAKEIDEVKNKLEDLKRESEEKVKVKVLKEEKKSTIDKLKKQLEVFLGNKRVKGKEKNHLHEEGSTESDLLSIELNKESNKWAHTRYSVNDSMKRRCSFSEEAPRRSTPLLRSVSNVIKWDIENSEVRRDNVLLSSSKIGSPSTKRVWGDPRFSRESYFSPVKLRPIQIGDEGKSVWRSYR